MKTLRILILVLSIPVFVSAVLADAIDQGGIVARTLQISSAGDDLDLLCDKLKPYGALSRPPQPAGPSRPCQRAIVQESAFKAITRTSLPFFIRPPPLA